MERCNLMKTIRKTYWLVFLMMMGFQIQLVNAQYAEDVLRFSQFGSSVGARSQGMGNTVVGIADDFSALFGNPAGLSQQKSFEFSVGLSRLGYGNDVTFFGNKTTDNNNAINLNNLALVYPVATSRGGLTFAFGFGRVANYTSVASFDGFNPSSSMVRSFSPYVGIQNGVFDLLTLSKPDAENLLNNNLPFSLYLADTSNDFLYPVLTDSVQQTVKVLEGGGMNHWSFGGGIDIAPNLSVGVTLNFASGSYSYDREYTESDSRNIYKSSYGFPFNFTSWTYTSTIKSDITGFNALFGLMYRNPGKYRVGATVRIPTTYDISETFTNDGVSNFDDGFTASTPSGDGGHTTYKVITPTVLSGGISVQTLDWLSLAGDAEYTDWTQMEFDTDNPDLIKRNRNIKNLMRETWNLRGGAEATIFNWGLILRAGIESKPSPWKGDPTSYDQLTYTAGIGILIDGSSTFNASFASGKWNTYRDNYFWGNTPASQTSESVTTQTINLTFSHRF
jgi:long-subunit fatty acid transport protein